MREIAVDCRQLNTLAPTLPLHSVTTSRPAPYEALVMHDYIERQDDRKSYNQ